MWEEYVDQRTAKSCGISPGSAGTFVFSHRESWLGGLGQDTDLYGRAFETRAFNGSGELGNHSLQYVYDLSTSSIILKSM